MITIKSIYCSGGACPYQIEATTDTGEFFYLRYRNGRLRAGVSKTEKDFKYNDEGYNVINKKIGEYLDGSINHDKVMELLKNKVVFPEGFRMTYQGTKPEKQEEDDRL